MSHGRKREWAAPSASPSDVADTGEAIEQEMKRLRLAYDYSDANAQWTPPPRLVDDGDTDMEAVDGQDEESDAHGLGAGGASRNAEYAEANALLRAMHFLRQLRKFQAARSVADRHHYLQQQQQQQQQQQLQHSQQAPDAYLRDPRY